MVEDSAQSCGCDPGMRRNGQPAPHVCEAHQERVAYGIPSASRDRLIAHLDDVVNRTWNFAGRLDTPREEMMNVLLGLGGEVGEVLDQFKKIYYHSVPEGDLAQDAFVDEARLKVRREMGDVLYYWLKLVDLLAEDVHATADFTISEIIHLNREKLESRHPELGKVSERFRADAIR